MTEPEHQNTEPDPESSPSVEELDAMFQDPDFQDKLRLREPQFADIAQLEAKATALYDEWKASGKGWDPAKRVEYDYLTGQITLRSERYARTDGSASIPEKTPAQSSIVRFGQSLIRFFTR